ncbi:MAG: peptide ABC transporter substrate-binding protein [Treponema sp.]|nr:peptide ABC transporter substrate-binding protein [Treponema sp.]
MNKIKKRFLLILTVILFAACQTSQVQEQGIQAAREADNRAEMRPENRTMDELTVVFSRHTVNLDYRKSYFASEAQIITAIHEGLFSYHPVTLEPVPAMAERWHLSEDKLEWTFTIRRNARFSNGDPVQAENFRLGWLSLLEPEREAPYASFFDIIEGARDFRNGTEKDPDKVGIRAVDARTLVVKLNNPASFFPSMLCHHSFSPIHRSMINVADWSNANIIVNGPFRITSVNDDIIVMQKNQHYWDRANVELNKLTIKFTDNGEEAAHLWNSGEARWIAGNVDMDALTDRSGIQVNIMFATHYYYIRSTVKPFDDHRVRRAMALVLPWNEIRSAYYLPAENFIFPIRGYPQVKGISEPDYDEAKRLMIEAGYSSLEGLPDLVIRLPPSRDAARVGALMANAWKDILGFNVRVEVISYETYFDTLKEDNYTVATLTWIGDFADPYAFLKLYKADSNLNDAGFNDADYEALIARSMTEEGTTRFATLAEAEKLLLDRALILPICFTPAVNIVDTGELDGWFPNALDIHPFKYLSFKAFRPLPGVALVQ